MGSNKKDDKSNWPIAAGLFAGFGLGLITYPIAGPGAVPGFTLLGFGLGILITFLFSRKKK